VHFTITFKDDISFAWLLKKHQTEKSEFGVFLWTRATDNLRNPNAKNALKIRHVNEPYPSSVLLLVNS